MIAQGRREWLMLLQIIHKFMGDFSYQFQLQDKHEHEHEHDNMSPSSMQGASVCFLTRFLSVKFIKFMK